MAYGVRWSSYKPIDAVKEAEKRALLPGRTWGLGFLYRFEEHTYAASSGWDDDTWVTVGPYLELTAFLIRSKTPKGWTIEADNANGWRFIGEHDRKRYACPTIKEALESYIARKKKQASIYRCRLERAEEMIRVAETAMENETTNQIQSLDLGSATRG